MYRGLRKAVLGFSILACLSTGVSTRKSYGEEPANINPTTTTLTTENPSSLFQTFKESWKEEERRAKQPGRMLKNTELESVLSKTYSPMSRAGEDYKNVFTPDEEKVLEKHIKDLFRRTITRTIDENPALNKWQNSIEKMRRVEIEYSGGEESKYIQDIYEEKPIEELIEKQDIEKTKIKMTEGIFGASKFKLGAQLGGSGSGFNSVLPTAYFRIENLRKLYLEQATIRAGAGGLEIHLADSPKHKIRIEPSAELMGYGGGGYKVSLGIKKLNEEKTSEVFISPEYNGNGFEIKMGVKLLLGHQKTTGKYTTTVLSEPIKSKK